MASGICPAATLVDAPLPAEYGYDDAAVWTGPGRHVFDGTERSIDANPAAAHDQVAASWLSVAATDHAVRFIRDSQASAVLHQLMVARNASSGVRHGRRQEILSRHAEPQRTYYAAVTRADRQVGRVLDVLDEIGIANDTIVIFSSDNGPENSQPNPDR